MELDVRTIFFMLGLATLAASASLFLAQRVKLSVRGIDYWAWGFACGGFSGFLLALRGSISPAISVLLANIILLLASSLIWMGMRRFVGRPPRILLLLAAPAFASPFLATHYLDDNDAAGRIAFLSAIVAVLMFLTARELITEKAKWSLGRRWVTFLLCLHGAFFVFRAIASSTGTPVADPFAKGSLAMATGIEAFLFMVFLTLGLVIMTSETLQTELNRQATRDPLTDAYNRRAFHEMFDHEVSRARRSGNPLSLLLIDFDHFKRLNDTHGHQVGDQALKHFVAVVSPCLRSQDVLARYGGEEFIIMLPETDADTAMVVANRIRGELASCPLPAPNGPLGITVSIGVAASPPDLVDLSGMVNRADTALYQAKASGRDCAVMA